MADIKKLAIPSLFIILALSISYVLTGCGGLSDAEKHNNRGVELQDDGRYDEAIEEYTKAIELDPSLAMAYNNRGIAYNELGQYEQAISDYTQVIELDLDYAQAYFGRGIAYKELGKKEEAIADFEKFITLTSNTDWIEQAESEIAELGE